MTDENPYACEHPDTETRRRTVAGGQVQYWRQCLRCGQGIRAVKPSTSAALGFGRDFDEALKERWQAARSAWWTARAAASEQEWRERRAADEAAFWERYDAYLTTPEWRERRRRVLERAAGVCEGCGVGRAVQVHHVSYKRLGNEMLWDLVAVCHACHLTLHPQLAPTIIGGVGRYEA